MIKAISIDKAIRTTAERETEHGTVTDEYCLTQFVCDSAQDVQDLNGTDSPYLNYPSGSAALCLADGKVYILNAAHDEYVEVG